MRLPRRGGVWIYIAGIALGIGLGQFLGRWRGDGSLGDALAASATSVALAALMGVLLWNLTGWPETMLDQIEAQRGRPWRDRVLDPPIPSNMVVWSQVLVGGIILTIALLLSMQEADVAARSSAGIGIFGTTILLIGVANLVAPAARSLAMVLRAGACGCFALSLLLVVIGTGGGSWG